MLTIELPIVTVSEANRRGHWRQHHRRHASQRGVTAMSLQANLGRPPPPPVRVVLTRISPRALDSDNLHGALKHVRDGVADWLGVDDGDERVTWAVQQRRGAPKQRGVRIEIEKVDDEEHVPPQKTASTSIPSWANEPARVVLTRVATTRLQVKDKGD